MTTEPESIERCACNDRAANACPGQWEPGCDLGANPTYARRATDIIERLQAEIERTVTLDLLHQEAAADLLKFKTLKAGLAKAGMDHLYKHIMGEKLDA